MSDKNKTDDDSGLKKINKITNLQEKGLRLYNLKQSTRTQKEKNGCSPSDVAYNVNTCKCGYTLTFSIKTQKGHSQVM